MLRATPGALLLLAAGCAAPTPRTVELRDHDAVIEEVATEVESDSVYGELPPADPSMTACFMDGEILPRTRAMTVDHSGRSFSFCSFTCRDAFQREPDRWIGAARHKGLPAAAAAAPAGGAEPMAASR